MNTRMFFICCLFCFAFQAISQTTSQSMQNLTDINVICLIGSDQMEIHATGGAILEAKATLKKEGKIRGWAFPDVRPKFEIKTRHSHDTLFMYAPNRYNPSIIGISTYTESIKMMVNVPADKELIISNLNRLDVNGMFQVLNISDTKKVFCNSLVKENIQSLKCISSKKMLLNGKPCLKSFEQIGIGTMNIQIVADEIQLTVVQVKS